LFFGFKFFLYSIGPSQMFCSLNYNFVYPWWNIPPFSICI
jgi:hypothetical protein